MKYSPVTELAYVIITSGTVSAGLRLPIFGFAESEQGRCAVPRQELDATTVAMNLEESYLGRFRAEQPRAAG